MRAIVAGCGYLGQRGCRALAAIRLDGASITRSAERAARWQIEGYRPLVGDITSEGLVPELPDADVLLYAVGYDRNCGRSRRDVTVDGLQRFLKRAGNSFQRLIYISTTSVYHQSAGEWINEESPSQPQTEPGRLALEAEELLLDRVPGSKVSILRFAGIYGPLRVLAKAEDLKSQQPLSGRSDAWLNLIHVEDGARAIHAIATSDQPPKRMLVCDDHPALRADYYSYLARLINAPAPRFTESDDRARGSSGRNKRCSNVLLKQYLNEGLKYPSFLQGLPQALSAPVEE